MPEGIKRIFQTPLDVNASSDLEEVGTIRWEGNKCYKWVQHNQRGAVATAAGQVVYYDSAGDMATDTSQITADWSASLKVGAGVAQSVITDTYYGWIQIKGPATLTIALDSGADGQSLTAGPTATGVTDGSLVVNSAVTDIPVAVADDASAKEIVCDFPF